jgi:hypothetical protein
MTLYEPTSLWTDDEVDVPTYGSIKKEPRLDLAGFVASWLCSRGFVTPYLGNNQPIGLGEEQAAIITSASGVDVSGIKKVRLKNASETDVNP